jgi:hypothetical protein
VQELSNNQTNVVHYCIVHSELTQSMLMYFFGLQIHNQEAIFFIKSAWLATYIECSTSICEFAKNEFEIERYQLIK